LTNDVCVTLAELSAALWLRTVGRFLFIQESSGRQWTPPEKRISETKSDCTWCFLAEGKEQERERERERETERDGGGGKGKTEKKKDTSLS
jgi:hypothetical protein